MKMFNLFLNNYKKNKFITTSHTSVNIINKK